MKRTTGLTSTVCAAAMIAACGTIDPSMAPTSSNAFNQTLGSGYADLASNEQAEYDWRDSRHFAQKAVAAGSDEAVEPDTFDYRDIPAANQDELGAARVRLMSAYGQGAQDAAPVEVATAQVMFDCWMQEQEENHQPTDISACRAGYEDAMDQVDGILLASAGGVGPYNVFFDFDASTLTADAGSLLSTILADIAKTPDAKVVVTGHTDTVGSQDYNLALSQQRADAVAAYLEANGVPAGAISKAAVGQDDLLVQTADGVRNAQNRRDVVPGQGRPVA